MTNEESKEIICQSIQGIFTMDADGDISVTRNIHYSVYRDKDKIRIVSGVETVHMDEISFKAMVKWSRKYYKKKEKSND